jgi:HK97 family phage major capsid protein
MPYSLSNLPPSVRNLSAAEQKQWLDVFNAVYQQTHSDEKAFAAAWGAITKARQAVKSRTTGDGKVIVEGWAMLFTDATDKDLHGEYFSRATKLLLEYYQAAPLWGEHGFEEYDAAPIGRRTNAEIYGYGVWLEHELHQDHPLFDKTREGCENGEFAYSSDSIRHYVQQGFDPSDGRLGVWPFAGCSLTRDPAEPGLGPVSIRAFKSAVRSQIEKLPLEAREAQKGATPNLKPGVDMTPEMLAALAEFLGVEATPEAVVAALQELLTQLQGSGDASGTPSEAITDDMMSNLRSALGLAETAGKADIVAKLNEIAKMLAEPAPAGRSLNFDALKRFSTLAEEALEEPDEDEEEPPFQVRKHNQPTQPRRTAPHQNGRAKKPGLVDMLRAVHPLIPKDVKVAKAQSYQIGPQGGFLLNHEVADTFLPALRDALPLVDMGVQQFDMDGVESLTIPRDRGENEAYWVGEDTTIPESEEQSGGIVLFPRPLAARIRIPNKFLANSAVDYEARVREKVIYRINRAIMRAALYGTGGTSSPNVGAQPIGLATLAGLAGRAVTKTTLGTGNGAKPKLKDLTDAIGRIEDANVELTETTAYLFAPRTKRFFADMTDTTGQPLLRGSWAEKEERDLAGYPWEITNLISVTEVVGTSSDCSTIFTGVWNQMALGISNQFEFLVDPYSEAKNLMTVIIAWTYADVQVLYDEAFEVINGVKP